MSRQAMALLLFVTLLSGAVVVEAERNYASVTSRDETTAVIVDARVEHGTLAVDLRVNNLMNEPLRIQYVYLSVSRSEHTDGASTPFKGMRSLSSGENDLTIHIPARQISGNVSVGDSATVSGEIMISVYNGYEFAIPIEEREMTL